MHISSLLVLILTFWPSNRYKSVHIDDVNVLHSHIKNVKMHLYKVCLHSEREFHFIRCHWSPSGNQASTNSTIHISVLYWVIIRHYLVSERKKITKPRGGMLWCQISRPPRPQYNYQATKINALNPCGIKPISKWGKNLIQAKSHQVYH